jgi:hypothetical protein
VRAVGEQEFEIVRERGGQMPNLMRVDAAIGSEAVKA